MNRKGDARVRTVATGTVSTVTSMNERVVEPVIDNWSIDWTDVKPTAAF